MRKISKSKSTKPATKRELPPDIIATDLEWPNYKSKDKMAYDVGNHGHLTFYRVEGFGWCIATLHIANARRGQTAERTYATKVDGGGVVRIGNGPHVKDKIEIHIRTSRVAALKKYIDLYNTGATDANMVRDRVSSRRAEGTLRRSRGESWWRWSV